MLKKFFSWLNYAKHKLLYLKNKKSKKFLIKNKSE